MNRDMFGTFLLLVAFGIIAVIIHLLDFLVKNA